MLIIRSVSSDGVKINIPKIETKSPLSLSKNDLMLHHNSEVYELIKGGNKKCFYYKFGEVHHSYDSLKVICNNIPKHIFIRYITMEVNGEIYIMDNILDRIVHTLAQEDLHKFIKSILRLDMLNDNRLQYILLILVSLGYSVDDVNMYIDHIIYNDLTMPLSSAIYDGKLFICQRMLPIYGNRNSYINDYIISLIEYLADSGNCLISDITEKDIEYYGKDNINDAIKILSDIELVNKLLNIFELDDLIELIISYRFDRSVLDNM